VFNENNLLYRPEAGRFFNRMNRILTGWETELTELQEFGEPAVGRGSWLLWKDELMKGGEDERMRG